ncbi:FAD-dependent oxidoreductase [Mesorhizobium sp. NZP2077]|uniref:oxidoreductase n=1 Tax=Mesorhizobium sp. NZP2077 TaxID=2483404 RepID=UPI001554DA43|nr:FAD-dependent oxidoreductase [Mesorhizobium sp. NZP2077]QKC86897.1 FAD-dependent oxidoreductase [Mesorhizobium sp. NZP2077]QKD20597.1 FAD-dependent oxidoreductase [Mesorhizobium sp. NZP2077]
MAASLKFLSPIELRTKALRNRVVFGAHTANMAENGLSGARHIAYYEERARGGAAMIVVEPMPVHAATVLTRGNFRPSDDLVIPAFTQVTDAIKRHGALAIQQIYHVGSHGDSDLSYHAHWSPSGSPSYHDSDGSHVMSAAEIEETIDGFVNAARRCHEAGFNGVEVWAAYHSLLDQFWTPWSNRRDDQWGGSLGNRTRLSRTILQRIREVCGPEFIVGLAISDEQDSGGVLARPDLVDIIAVHDEARLIDYVTCGTGSYFDFYKIMPTFLYPEKLGVDLAETVKKRVTHALVIAESHIRTPENAEAVIASGSADLVSIVRGQIADPHLVNKAAAGRPEDVRGCLSCNQMCWGRRSRDYWISCLVNPSAGREFEWGGDRFDKASRPNRVLVVGGGPAGLEAARVAAERGHTVTLAEASSVLGGNFRLAGLQPRRAQILELLEWYERQLQRLNVEVRLNTYVEAAEVVAEAADHVIIATGSLPRETGFQKALPQWDIMPGWERGNTYSVEAIMARQARPGKRVLLLDESGGWRGCGTAWKLADDGHEVTLVTPDPMVGRELQRMAADAPLRKVLAKLGVHFVLESSILEWHGDGATVLSHLDGRRSFIEADTIVTATTNVAANSLAQELLALAVPFHEIGDGVAPRQAPYAIFEGRKIGLAL